MNFSLIATFVVLGAAAETAHLQAQPEPNALVTVTTNPPAAPSRPASTFVLKPVGLVKEVQKLTQAGTDPGLIKTFVQSWRTPYSVSADDILHLHEVGVPSDTLTILIQHQSELGSQSAVAANPNMIAGSPAAPLPYPGGIPPTDPSWSGTPSIQDQYAPPPAYNVEPWVYTDPSYPAYDYGYYGYPAPYSSYYYPGVSIGLGFGYRGYGGYHGRYYGGHGGGFVGRSGGFVGHAGSFGGRPGSGFVGHGGGFGGRPGGSIVAHGGGFGGHAGGVGGRSGGGHR